MLLAVQVSVALVAVAVFLLYRFLTETFEYWKKKGVVFIKPSPLVGSTKSVFFVQEHFAEYFERVYKEYENEPFVGYFMGRTPTLMVNDPEIIKHILIKDFSHFTDHGFTIHEEADPLQAKSLFNLQGQQWKDMRAKLLPTFTSGKMKGMLPLMQEVAAEFDSKLNELAAKKEEFEIRNILACFFTDIVATCIFGIKCNSVQDPDVEFRRVSKKLIELSFFGAIKAMVIFFAPELAHHLRLGMIEKDATNFFRKLVKDVMDMRKSTGITRKDFIQLLIELKEKGEIAMDKEDAHEVKEEISTTNTPLKLTHDDLTAQATVFFLAGFDTSASASSYACWELAANPEVQKKAQDEIDEIFSNHDGKLTHEALKEIKYLECVINETLRMHPVVANLVRKCNKNYKIPGTELEIDSGVMINIPISALHKDPKYFDEPETFSPERFQDKAVVQKTQMIFTPFGIGPRQCIGNRFALLQTKLSLVTILRNYNLEMGEKTKVPLQLDRRQFIARMDGGTWVKLTPRNEE